MATTFVPVNTGQRLGQQLRNAIDQLHYAKTALAHLKSIMDTQISAADYSMVESQFGLQAGQGQTCYNLVAGSITDIVASSNVTQTLNWLG